MTRTHLTQLTLVEGEPYCERLMKHLELWFAAVEYRAQGSKITYRTFGHTLEKPVWKTAAVDGVDIGTVQFNETSYYFEVFAHATSD